MKIGFFYEWGKIAEVGTGHKYRSQVLGHELRRRGHKVVNEYKDEDIDVLVIDHVYSQKNIIEQAKAGNTKVVLIDGVKEDVPLVDLSISAFQNSAAQHTGVKYAVFPKYIEYLRYASYGRSKVFVSMGGFDANNHAEKIVKLLDDMGLHAIVTKSINHDSMESMYNNVTVFDGNDYYEAMRDCVIGITNGGLTLLQALYYGLPTIAIPQYEHQRRNIDSLSICCITADVEEQDIIREQITHLIDNVQFRKDLSKISKTFVDGMGIDRVCDLIESLK